MMHTDLRTKNRSRAWPIAVALAALTACDGSSNVGQVGQDGAQPSLVSVEIGRLVDVYSFQLASPGANPDRRLRANRRLELIAENVVVNASIESDSLFDAAGQRVANANYEFLPFDKALGHEQLVILWDDRPGTDETAKFADALENAQIGLQQLPASYRNQNTSSRAIPIVPRNAAIKLNFSGPLNVTPEFFLANPSAVQVLEFKGDPDIVDPVDAFRILPYRVVTKDNAVILDTTILGGEAAGGITSPGLPLSADRVTANIRIAIPARGQVLNNFYVDRDGVAELNDVDSAGRVSVIRDFRSGNLEDGVDGRLSEPDTPKIVAGLPMGITSIDKQNQTVTVNKRLNFVPIRGRYPFVDGPLQADGVPTGPQDVPMQRALRAGDLLTQDVTVEVNGSFEVVNLRAEVLENLSIISESGNPNVGKAPSSGGGFDQGAFLPQVTLRVASIEPARDSLGRLVQFRANTSPLGEECSLRAIYIEDVPFNSSGSVSDRQWRNLFARIEPAPGAPGVDIQPNASISIEFTKPMDLDQVDNTANFLVTNTSSVTESFAEQMTDPKRATTRVVPTRLTDLSGDGTVLRLQPPLGFAHEAGASEVYSVHVRLSSGGVTDLAGNSVEIFDDLSAPQDAWSVDFQLDPQASSNIVSWHTYMFSAEDEDGTLPGPADMFGQWRLENGRLFAASGVRFGRSASNDNLGTISRITRGECWDSGDPTDAVDNPFGYPGTVDGANTQVTPVAGPPALTVDAQSFTSPNGHTGALYWTTQMVDQVAPPNVPTVYEYYQQVPQPVGRVVEPLTAQGSRMQMRFIEEDFTLNYTQPSEFGLDVEQLYWSPYSDGTVLYDEFDRFTMSLGHARTRGDERWLLGIDANDASWCVLDCGSMNSGLSTIFADNVLEGSAMTPVFEDKVYAVNPNEAFRDGAQVSYVPYPRFDRSYTWRDSRLVTLDATGEVIGLGGSQNPGANVPNNDTTADIDSPWITSRPDPEFAVAGSGIWVKDPGDFVGNNQRDHDPIALPLLVDMKVFPDDPTNGIATASNALQVAMLGPPSAWTANPPSPGGYYDAVPAGCEGARPPWPRIRVHASGGFDPSNPNTAFLVDPANVLQATGNVVKEAGAVLLGGSLTTALTPVPAGDGMLNWARADFVRKVSTVTFGFFDTLQPQRARIVNSSQVVQDEDGYPNWLGVNPLLRMTDVLVQLDPPQTRQPAGTGVVVELRGAETIFNASELYNPVYEDGAITANDLLPDFAAVPPENGRGNLLNPNYACEAYRYSTPNVGSSPRIATTGMTRYVTDDQVEAIRDPATGLYPRFLNVRLVMQNNVDVSPALSPSLRSMSIVYRLTAGQ